MDAQRQRGALRQVDASHPMRRLPVIDPHHNASARDLVGHPHDGSQRYGTVRRSHPHRVIALAARRDVRRPLPVIPGGLADLQHPLGRRAARLALAEARRQAAEPVRNRTGIGGQCTGKRVNDQSSFDEHASCVPDVISRSARSRRRDVLH